MILTACFSAFMGIINWLLGLLPTMGSFDTTNAIAAVSDNRIWEYLSWANWYTAIDSALLCVSLRVAFGVVMFGWEFITWGLTKLHILGGSS